MIRFLFSTILNIVSNFISNETITCDDWDLPWMNSFIKNLIRAKDNFYKKFVRKSSNMYQLAKPYKSFYSDSKKKNYANKIAQRLGN